MSTINLKQLDLSSIPGSAKWDLVWFLSRKHSTLPRKQGGSNLSFHTQLFSNTSFQATSPSPNLLNSLVHAKENINRITSTSCFTKSFHVFFFKCYYTNFCHPSKRSSHSPRVMVNQIGGVEVVIDIIEVALHFKDIRCRKVHCDGCTFRQIDTVTQVVEAPTQKRWGFPTKRLKKLNTSSRIWGSALSVFFLFEQKISICEKTPRHSRKNSRSG